MQQQKKKNTDVPNNHDDKNYAFSCVEKEFRLTCEELLEHIWGTLLQLLVGRGRDVLLRDRKEVFDVITR